MHTIPNLFFNEVDVDFEKAPLSDIRFSETYVGNLSPGGAGTTSGFSTTTGFGAVDQNLVYAKHESMAEVARIASKRLWR